MKNPRFSYLFVSLLLFCGPVTAQQRVQVSVPSAEQEATYIWQTISDINFFEQQNYQLSLPQGSLMSVLLEKARKNQLADTDFEALKKFINDEVYDAADYVQGKHKISSNLSALNDMINQIIGQNRVWSFKAFDTYQVQLTLYGPGGSFDPDNGSILILTTADGGFKQYKDPINIIIHEVVHIGIEHSIIQAFNVPHGLKERIVDTFVLLNFSDDLPDYKKQPMGDPKLNDVLKNTKDLERLAQVIEKFMAE